MDVKKRRAQIKIAGKWLDCSFSDVKEGDLFRLFEEDDTPVAFEDGTTEFTASADAFQDNEMWILETKDDEE